MSQITVTNLTFAYDGSYDNIFENASFTIDTDWRLGLIGRNGRGKTTLLNLLRGKYQYSGSISSNAVFDYFPYEIQKEQEELKTIEVIEALVPDYELWRLCIELDLLRVDTDVLYRPYNTLSFGEKTKVMLALLFSREGNFLLIDEPTNHLDMLARELVKNYLKSKKGYILVSHDKAILDECTDHILSINPNDITVTKGNFSVWQENKQRQDDFEKAENEKLKSQIAKLKHAARQTEIWADKSESKKIGFDPKKEPDRNISTRAYLGKKSKDMQKRRKDLENRQNRAIDEKSRLLKNIEKNPGLKLSPLEHFKSNYVTGKGVSISYRDNEIISGLDFSINKGDRIALRGANGCGKSSLIKAILQNKNSVVLNNTFIPENLYCGGELNVASNLIISYINQDTSHLKGSLDDYIASLEIDESLFKALLRQLAFDRTQFNKDMLEYSQGQKKKVLIASSLLQKAHLYIWDEPLNYIDIFSRIQIEDLILKYNPTMLFVEHDISFTEKIATGFIDFQ